MKNILLMNFGGIGDEILFLPVIKTLKEEFRESKITLCLEPRSACINDLTPLIDDVIKADIKKAGFSKYFEILRMLFKIRMSKFDVIIASGKSPFISIIAFLSGIKRRIGFKTKTSFLLTDEVELNENQYASNMYHDLLKPITDRKCEIPSIEMKDENMADYLLGGFLNQEYIAIHPGVSQMSIRKNIYKSLSPEKWRELISQILEKGKKVVLLGGRDDKEIIGSIVSDSKIAENENFLNLYMKTKSLMELACLIKKSACFVCADSAPLHIGVGLNKKTLAFFGPTNEEKLLPYKENFIPIRVNLPCRPCLWHKRQCNCENSECLNIDISEFIERI